MKRVLNILVTIVIFASCSQSETDEATTGGESPQPSAPSTGFDAELAASLGADQYGMKQYVMAFLKAGPNRDQDSTTAAQIQAAHMENIGRMAEAGKLVLAGPFLAEGDYQGIYIFNVTTIEEARRLTESDPAIQAGRLVMELHPWYGSAALMQVNEIHSRLSQANP